MHALQVSVASRDWKLWIVSGRLWIVRDNFSVSLHTLSFMHWLFATSIDLLYVSHFFLTQFSPCTERCDCWGLWAPFPVQRLQHPHSSPQLVWDYWDVEWTKSVKQTEHSSLSPHAVVHPVMKMWKQFFEKPSVILAALSLPVPAPLLFPSSSRPVSSACHGNQWCYTRSKCVRSLSSQRSAAIPKLTRQCHLPFSPLFCQHFKKIVMINMNFRPKH